MPRAPWLAVLLLLAAVPASAKEPVFPRPAGATSWSNPTQMQMGTVPLTVRRCATRLSAAEIRAFYDKALPGSGWRIEDLPWQRQQRQAFEQLSAARKDLDTRGTDTAELDARLSMLEQGTEDLQRQVYAERQGERALVTVESMGGHTVVFLKRWQGGTPWRTLDAGAPAAGTSTSWPGTNPCCGTGPGAATATHPMGLPHYPGARTVASSAIGQDGANVVLVTPDAQDQITAFYERQLGLAGWTFEREQDPGVGRPGTSRWYTDARRRLLMTVGAAGASGTERIIMLSVAPRVQNPWAKQP